MTQAFPFHTLLTKEVRELAWVLCSENLFISKESISKKHFTPNNNELLKILYDLDANPESLIAHLRSSQSFKIGHRFEALLEFWLKYFTSIKITRKNWQIIKDKKTLGEMDLLLGHQKVMHWELCVKFYLFYNGKWFGPNANDRLDLKTEKLFNHQLKLPENPFVKLELQKHQIEIISSQVLAKGVLFLHYFNPIPSIDDQLINASCMYGKWLYLDEYIDLKTDGDWKIIEKNEWLDPFVQGPFHDITTAKNKATTALKKKKSIMLRQLVLGEQFPWMICQRDWPNE